jgi:hypothetical protein
MRVREEGKRFFFEKKNQKIFMFWPLPPSRHAGQGAQPKIVKVFWFFFS